MLQADLIHRYEFGSNLNDSVIEGAVDGVIRENYVDSNGELTTHIINPSYTLSQPTGIISGAPTKAIDFDVVRSVDSGEVGETTQSSVFTIDGSVMASSQTVACWFKFDARDASGVVDYLFRSSQNLWVYLKSNKQLAVKNAHTSSGAFAVSEVLTENSWHHLAITWVHTDDPLIVNDGVTSPNTTMSVYLNGVNLSEDSLVAHGAFNLLNVGNYSDSGGQIANQFDGQMYDLQFYSDRLAGDDITELYQNPGFAFPELSNSALLLGLVLSIYFIGRRRFQPVVV